MTNMTIGTPDGLNAMQRGRLEAIAIAEMFGTTSQDAIDRERQKVLDSGTACGND